MHLESGDLLAGLCVGGFGLGQGLVAAEHGLDVEQPETGHPGGLALDAIGIGDALAQHLIAAADAEHRAAAAMVGRDVDIPALFPQEGEIGDGRLGPRQDDEVSVPRQRIARRHHVDGDVGLGAQGVEIVEIGDAREHRHGDADRPVGRLVAGHQAHRVLRRQAPGVREPRHHAETLEPGAVLDHPEPAFEQAGIAAELVDDVPLDARAMFRGEKFHGADDARDHAAAVDVADQDHRQIGGSGEAHIGDVDAGQVDLRRASRAFDQDQFRRRRKAPVAGQHHGQQFGLHRRVVARLDVAAHPAVDDDLRADVGLRLEQHRVHVGAGGHQAGLGLQRLGAADLAPVLGHRGIVRHVLGLERAHREAAPDIGPSQPGDQQGLAHVRAGALKHDRRRAQNSMPFWALTPARNGCLTITISVTRSAISISGALALRPVTTTCRSGGLFARKSTTCSRSR